MTSVIDAPIIAGPYRKTEHEFIAVLSLINRGGRPFWLAVCKPGTAEPILASRMVALLILHRSHPLLHPVLVPTAPAPTCAFFLDGGYWSDNRNLAFPEEVRAEVDRIATVLRTDFGTYVADFVAALSGKRPKSFYPVPRDLPVSDPNDEYSLVPIPPAVQVDTAALGKWGTSDLVGHLAASNYQDDRYLSGLSEDELTKRAIDAIVSTFDIAGERSLVADLADQGTMDAIARLGEVMEEIRLRHGELPEAWKQTLAAMWPGPGGTAERNRKALDWIASLQGAKFDGLARYSKLAHARAALERGRFQISPASGYSRDPSLNRAQAANELVFEHQVDVRRSRFELWSADRSRKLGDLSPERVTVTHRAGTDAYVLCCSRRVSARLFHDFHCDACLLIRDRPTFMTRLWVATNAVLEGWEMLAFDVGYIDPFSPTARHASPLFNKPASYQYQHEHRIIWLPPEPRLKLEPVFVEIGPLTDIAELAFIGEDGK